MMPRVLSLDKGCFPANCICQSVLRTRSVVVALRRRRRRIDRRVGRVRPRIGDTIVQDPVFPKEMTSVAAFDSSSFSPPGQRQAPNSKRDFPHPLYQWLCATPSSHLQFSTTKRGCVNGLKNASNTCNVSTTKHRRHAVDVDKCRRRRLPAETSWTRGVSTRHAWACRVDAQSTSTSTNNEKAVGARGASTRQAWACRVDARRR